MKISFVGVNVELSRREKLLLKWVAAPLTILLGGVAISWAAGAHVFQPGEILTADLLNSSFAAHQAQIDALTAKVPAVTAWSAVTGPIMRTSTSTPGAAVAGQRTTEFFRRVGDSAEVRVRTEFTDTPPTSGYFVWELPPGVTVDTAKMPSGTAWASVGVAEAWNGSAASICSVNIGSGFIACDCDGVSGLSATSPKTLAAGSVISLSFSLPVMGWSITP